MITQTQKLTMHESLKIVFEFSFEFSHFHLQLVQYLQSIKRSLLAFLCIFPTSLLAFILLLLLIFNAFSIFYVHVPSAVKTPPQSARVMPENAVGESVRKLSSSSSKSLSLMNAVKEENPNVNLKTNLPNLPKSQLSIIPINSSSIQKREPVRKQKPMFRFPGSKAESKRFSNRMKGFLTTSHCKVRFFMTWISSLQSFGDRELFAIESLFKSHPNACLIIVSTSIDSSKGNHLLKPFLNKGFKVTAIAPDFDYLFNKTPAESWFNGLREGNIDPGIVSLGQNLSNLLRLALLYKFGGIYLDTDVVVLKSFSKFRNSIGAQTMDLETGNWSRLNNAVLIFDKHHPLLFKFIKEFALTFDGNKWGHNGPYLVSRVVSRMNDKNPGLNFTVLPPSAFYPVYWSKIGSLFKGPRDEFHSKWLGNKLVNIQTESFAIHLWNKQSRDLEVEDGSIISHIMSDCCIFCNSSSVIL